MPDTAGDAPTRAGHGRRETVLIVDDHAVNRQVLASILRKEGYDLLEAADGAEALALALHTPVDLVLLDIMMPGTDGYEVCAALKRSPVADIPVIFLSALTDSANKVRGLELGAVDYVTKPFDRAEVVARVRTHLEMRRLTRALVEANRELVAKQEALDVDLRAAADIQRCLLPRHAPAVSAVRAAWRFVPCDRMGGDVCNLAVLDPAHVAAYVLDVSGHGVPAAMITVSVSQSLSPAAGVTVRPGPAGTATVARPGDVLRLLDREYPFERFERFFTIAYLTLEHTTGHLRYSLAGHPPPVLLRADGTATLLTAGGTIIGLGDAVPFDEDDVVLQRGDRVFLYSDGIVEFENAAGEPFGHDRFRMQVQAARGTDLEGACDTVMAALAAFGGTRPFQDDVTLLALEYTGP